MASNSKRTNNSTENKKKEIEFSLDQISQHLASMTGALGYLYNNQDLFNKLVESFNNLKMEEMAQIIVGGLQQTDKELAKDVNFVQSCIAELNHLIAMYQHISPILKMYQPEESKLKGGFHARGSSETN